MYWIGCSNLRSCLKRPFAGFLKMSQGAMPVTIPRYFFCAANVNDNLILVDFVRFATEGDAQV